MSFPKFLRIGVIPLRNVIELHTDSTGNVTFNGGVEANLVKVLSAALGFDYKLIIPRDKEWGRHPIMGKRWTGLIGMVQRNEADIAIGDLTITKQRARAVDFIPYTMEDNTFATRLPNANAKHGSYTHPFQWQVWLVTLLAVLVLPWFFKQLMRKKISLGRLFMVMTGCILNQPIPFVVKGLVNRFLFASWLLFGFFLSSCYTGLLLYSITFPVQEYGVADIDGLAKAVSAGTFKCMTHRGSVKIDMLTSSQNEALQIIGRNMIEKDWLSSSKTVIMPSEIDENVAVLGPRWLFHLQYGEEPFASKYLFEDSFGHWSIGIAVRKGFCCKKVLSIYVSRIMSTGIFKRIFDDQLLEARRRLKENDIISPINTSILTLRDLEGSFILLFVGWSSGILVCITNILFWYAICK